LRWFRSPFLHFVVLGTLIFIGLELWETRRANLDRAREPIEIDGVRLDTLERDFVAQMGRVPNAEELDGLIAAEVEDEILYREALARGLLERDGGVQTRLIQKMLFLEGETDIEDASALLARAQELGLHRGDIVVRRILVQKMRLLGSALAVNDRPSERDIAARYQEYAEQGDTLREPDRITFGHVFLSADRRGASTRADAEQLRARLVDESIGVDDAIALGDAFPLGTRFKRRSERELARTFGARFGTLALDGAPGRWSEPIESAYGQHLIYIEAFEPGVTPPLEAMHERLRRELERDAEAAQLERWLEELEDRYEVVITANSKEAR
jgi:peptidyl-prolyl cis-trans isomerase C